MCAPLRDLAPSRSLPCLLLHRPPPLSSLTARTLRRRWRRSSWPSRIVGDAVALPATVDRYVDGPAWRVAHRSPPSPPLLRRSGRYDDTRRRSSRPWRWLPSDGRRRPRGDATLVAQQPSSEKTWKPMNSGNKTAQAVRPSILFYYEDERWDRFDGISLGTRSRAELVSWSVGAVSLCPGRFPSDDAVRDTINVCVKSERAREGGEECWTSRKSDGRDDTCIWNFRESFLGESGLAGVFDILMNSWELRRRWLDNIDKRCSVQYLVGERHRAPSGGRTCQLRIGHYDVSDVAVACSIVRCSRARMKQGSLMQGLVQVRGCYFSIVAVALPCFFQMVCVVV